MSFPKKLLVWTAIIIVIFIGANFYISQQADVFKEKHQAFVHSFMQDLSTSWRLDDVKARLSADFLEMASSEEGQAYLTKFSTLGRFLNMQEVEMGKYFSGFDGTKGEFIFKAQFERALVLAKVTVNERPGDIKVLGITINSLDAEGYQTEFKPIN